MPYEFLDDAPPADVGFEAWGRSLGECFQAAADATLETMLANPDSLRQRESRDAHVENEELEIMRRTTSARGPACCGMSSCEPMRAGGCWR